MGVLNRYFIDTSLSVCIDNEGGAAGLPPTRHSSYLLKSCPVYTSCLYLSKPQSLPHIPVVLKYHLEKHAYSLYINIKQSKNSCWILFVSLGLNLEKRNKLDSSPSSNMCWNDNKTQWILEEAKGWSVMTQIKRIY